MAVDDGLTRSYTHGARRSRDRQAIGDVFDPIVDRAPDCAALVVRQQDPLDVSRASRASRCVCRRPRALGLERGVVGIWSPNTPSG